jgi:hypothetical protein
MAIDSTKLIEYAARNIPQVHIARALGISESRVTQLLDREDVQEHVAKKAAELASKDLATLTSLEKINTALLSKIDSLVEESDSLGEVVNAYEKLTKLQAQKQGGSSESEEGIRKITMQIPIFLQQNINITTSSNNEIIDINERAMHTMPTIDVHKLIKTHAKSKSKDGDPLEGVDPSTITF